MIAAVKRARPGTVVALLLADERVDPNMADEDSWTALMDAALNGHALSSAYREAFYGPIFSDDGDSPSFDARKF